ncbi:hypothetical protein N9L02_00295 [Gammaproteobacteria bacterium]|nr:hypothetical protein [Gammaproteobacteria bacterium]
MQNRNTLHINHLMADVKNTLTEGEVLNDIPPPPILRREKGYRDLPITVEQREAKISERKHELANLFIFKAIDICLDKELKANSQNILPNDLTNIVFQYAKRI